MKLFHDRSKVDKFREDSRLVFARGCRERKRNGCSVCNLFLFGGDENVLELGSSEDYTSF